MNDPVTRSSLAHSPSDDPNLAALAAFVDQRLGDDERREMAVHLAGCERCRDIVGQLARGRTPAASARWTRALPLAASVVLVTAIGGLYLVMTPSNQPSSSARAPGDALPGAAVEAPPVARAVPAPDRAVVPSPALEDRPRAAGEKSLEGKTFRLVAGEWIDSTYRVADGLPVVTVSNRADFDMSPELVPFTALGRRFTVVIDGTVYRVALPPPQN
jgi:hypothetical protein